MGRRRRRSFFPESSFAIESLIDKEGSWFEIHKKLWRAYGFEEYMAIYGKGRPYMEKAGRGMSDL